MGRWLLLLTLAALACDGGRHSDSAANDADDATPIFAGYINRLFELGITNGCATRTYCSTDPTLRRYAASFVARAFDLTLDVCTP